MYKWFFSERLKNRGKAS